MFNRFTAARRLVTLGCKRKVTQRYASTLPHQVHGSTSTSPKQVFIMSCAVTGGGLLGITIANNHSYLPFLFEVGPVALFTGWYFYGRKHGKASLSWLALATATGICTYYIGNRINNTLALDRSQENGTFQTESSNDSEATISGIPIGKFVYFVPILVAPLAHNLVTLAASSGSMPKARPYLIGAGLVTAGAIFQRLYLMEDAGIDSGRALWGVKQT